jgi:hypothetical protein
VIEIGSQQEDMLHAIQEETRNSYLLVGRVEHRQASVAAMKQAFDFTTHRITTGMDSLDSFKSFFGQRKRDSVYSCFR